MSPAAVTDLTARMVLLEQMIRRYQRLLAAVGLLLVIGLSLAARPASTVLEVLQTRRLEVLDAAGNVGITAYVTALGGRLDVLQPTGRALFSAGTLQGDKAAVGLWEQAQQALERHGRELEQQRRLLDDLGRQLARQAHGRQPEGGALTQAPEWTQLQHDLAHQRRSLEALERQVQSLGIQIRTLERR